MDTSWSVIVALVVAWVVLSKIYDAITWLQRTLGAASRPDPLRDRRAVTAPRPGQAAPRPGQAQKINDATRTAQAVLAPRLDELGRRAAQLCGEIRRERPNRRFVPTLESWVPARLDELRALLPSGHVVQAGGGLARLGEVLDEIEALVAQRRDPVLLPEVGDADTLAEACYAPIIAFCAAEDLPLTSGHPATQLGEFDLSIWVGFIPTSVAPIFLPPDFFLRAVWWPALAHEIGHDFLASVAGLDAGLRKDLDLPPAQEGHQPLALRDGGLALGELRRLFGGWFEEIFCDVFGVLMCGPAYVATMIELFSCDDDPTGTVRIAVDPSGQRYDPHPPRHLRLLCACLVLERGGFHADSKELRARWEARQRAAGADLDVLLAPSYGVLLRIRMEHFTALVAPMLEQLYAGPLAALGGRGLTAISGLDYGPHEHNEAGRARAALRAGRVPTVRDPRAVVAGVVLAALEDPAREAQAIAWGRAAIPALGTGERRRDAYSTEADAAGEWAVVGPLAVPRIAADVLTDALVLREILGRPRGLRGG